MLFASQSRKRQHILQVEPKCDAKMANDANQPVSTSWRASAYKGASMPLYTASILDICWLIQAITTLTPLQKVWPIFFFGSVFRSARHLALRPYQRAFSLAFSKLYLTSSRFR